MYSAKEHGKDSTSADGFSLLWFGGGIGQWTERWLQFSPSGLQDAGGSGTVMFHLLVIRRENKNHNVGELLSWQLCKEHMKA